MKIDYTSQTTGKSEGMQTADGTVSPGFRWDDTRLKLRRWPIPPLRPKRDAYVVAGLRSESGQGDARYVLIAELLASKPRPKLFHLTSKYIAHFRLPDIAGTIGAQTLQRFKVIFDDPHIEMILQPNEHFSDPST